MYPTTQHIDLALDEIWQNRRIPPNEYLQKVQKLLETSNALNYEKGQGAATAILGYAHTLLGNHAIALQTLDSAKTQLLDMPDNGWQVICLTNLAHLYTRIGLFKHAYAEIALALKIAQQLQDEGLIRRCNAQLGAMYGTAGEYQKAYEYQYQIVQSLDSDTKQQSQFSAHLNLAVTCVNLALPEQAIEYGKQALHYASSEVTYANSYKVLGNAYLLSQDFDLAYEYYQSALKILRSNNYPINLVTVLINFGRYWQSVDEPAKAISIFEEALGILDNVHSLISSSTLHMLLYESYKQLEEWENALRHYEQYQQAQTKMFTEQAQNYLKNLEITHKLEEAEATQEQTEKYNEIRLQMKDNLLSNISHDIKNPLATIKGSLYVIRQLLPESHLNDEKYTRHLRNIDRQTTTINAIIQDVLDLSSLETKAQSNTDIVEVCEMLNNAVQDVEIQANAKHIQITTICTAEIFCTVSKTHFTRMLTNLVTNAVKYTPDNGRVTITAKVISDNKLLIQVADNGVGIPKDIVPKIFDRFYRVQDHKTIADGTGLGLAIVKKIVEQHHGEISVESEVGNGTIFDVILPIN